MIKVFRFTLYVLIFTLCNSNLLGEEITLDSIQVQKGYMLVLKDTIILPACNCDTVILLSPNEKYKVKYNQNLKSQAFYDSLYSKSNEKKLWDEIFRFMVRGNFGEIDSTDNVNPVIGYLPYQGLQINNIFFYQCDVLAGSVMDTSVSAIKGIPKLLNSLHSHTKEKVLRKNLLFKEGETIDANRMADNERIIRSLNFIEDARILVYQKDEYNADVLLITKDIFPIGIGGGASSLSNFNIDLRHRNVLGWGQEIRYKAMYNADYWPALGSQLEYNLSNIANSFTTLNVLFRETLINTNLSIVANKPYMSPETKHAGGIELRYIRDKFSLSYPDSIVTSNFSRNSQKIWLGHNFMLSKEERKNLAVSGSYARTLYQDRPVISEDTNQYFQNSQLILGNLFLIKNRNITTRYLRYMGRTEDVHAGYIVSLTGGYIWSDFKDMYYAGIRLGYGYSFPRGGYFGVRAEYGSFFDQWQAEQGVALIRMLFYSRLLKVYHSSLRLATGIYYKEGINRYAFEWIGLGEVDGIDENKARGKSKTVLITEATYFSKINFYGFRFAPYCSVDLGLIRSDNPIFYDGDLHLSIGVGIRIRNESLVFQNLELGFVFYPSNPSEDRKYRFLFSSSEVDVIDDLKVGEPYVVPFRQEFDR